MKKLDLTKYHKRNQYEYFRTFSNPTYGFDALIDVTDLVKYGKEHKISFFPLFLYNVMLGVNSVYELKLREINNEVYYFDTIHPTFTVMSDSGVYQNCGFEMIEDFEEFNKKCKETVEFTKKLEESDELDRFPICRQSDVVFATCIPSLDYAGMSHPIPIGNYDSMSIPRICWGKYYENNGKFYVNLNITVSHTFVDGMPLASCFNKIREYVKHTPKEALELFKSIKSN